MSQRGHGLIDPGLTAPRCEMVRQFVRQDECARTGYAVCDVKKDSDVVTAKAD